MTIEGGGHFAGQDTGEYRRGEAIAKEGWMKTKSESCEKMSESQDVLFDDDDFIGHCSVPEHENYCLNIGPAHWMACDKCRIKWLIGANLFSSWRYQSPDTWRANEDKLREYREIHV